MFLKFKIQYEEKSNIQKVSNITLIAYGPNDILEKALTLQSEYHSEGKKALVELTCCQNKHEAESLLYKRGCNNLEWIDS